eukprot:Tamp_29238.p2 GENE.Tamp_29238~~Tamp_29238.p2  ORF type:complete len:197 (-),score=37.92 Tamp_29238:189-779(-)
MMELSGDVEAVGVVMNTESTAAAARAIKQDIGQTLCSRVEMLFEDWSLLEEEGALSSSSLPETWKRKENGAWALPRRLQFPLTGQIRLGQHVVGTDGAPEAFDNLQQMVADLKSVKEAKDAESLFVFLESAPVVTQSAANAKLAGRKSSGTSASRPAAGGGEVARAGGGMNGGVVAVAAMVALYAMELVFDFLPFI